MVMKQKKGYLDIKTARLIYTQNVTYPYYAIEDEHEGLHETCSKTHLHSYQSE